MAEPARPASRIRPRTVALCLVLAAACAGLAVLAIGIGTVALPPPVVVDALLGIAHPADVHIVRELRLPRIATALLVGACLAAAGTLLQSVGRNDLADPSLLGMTSGAALAHVGAGLLLPNALVSLLGPGLAVAGAAATLLLTVALARGAGGPRLLLYGVVVGSVISSALSVLLSLRGELLATVMRWVIGSLNARTGGTLPPVLVLAAIGTVLALLALRGTVLLWVGEDQARTVGSHPGRSRALALGAVIALVGAAALGAGSVAFIGLVAPHLARRLVGTHPARVLPVATLLGALLLLAADAIGQLLSLLQGADGGTGLPVGAVTAVLGGPFLLALLLRPETEPR